MAAAGRETGEGAMRLKEGAKNQGTGGDTGLGSYPAGAYPGSTGGP